jgi:hypothetical protein
LRRVWTALLHGVEAAAAVAGLVGGLAHRRAEPLEPLGLLLRLPDNDPMPDPDSPAACTIQTFQVVTAGLLVELVVLLATDRHV